MAISNVGSRDTYTLDSVTTDFDITFDCVYDDNGDATELTVWLIEDGERTEIQKGYTSDKYSVQFKTITYLDATLHAGAELLITRATPRTQLQDFVNNGAYNLNQIEAMSDKLTRIEQEQDAEIADRIVASEDAADRAEQSAQDAEESALAASSSETNAGISETNAGVSETNSASSALVSEGWAKGTQNGTPVGSTSPYYEDNAKYYSDYASTKIDSHATALAYLDTSSAKIDIVANINSDITTVAGMSSDISSVIANETNINTVATNVSDIAAVASDMTNINTVAGISSDISDVADNETNINTVATNASGVGTVASNIANVNTVATNVSDVSTVATNVSDVGTVATNISDINDIADNLSGILNSEEYASLSRQYDEGKKLDGTPVTSGEEGYENNAKYWADVASHYAVGTLVKLVRWS